jgi:UDP-N-acetylmuramyl pentapeptide phosphotransferase/UDP-N-acetylglucosamine-1-phosphate transferase
MIPALLLLACSAFVVFLLCFPLRNELRRRQLLDCPNDRSSHSIPTPRGGGIAIVGVLLAALVSLGFFFRSPLILVLLIAVAAIAAVSWWDDAKGVSARVRFGVHAAAALAYGAVIWRTIPSEMTALAPRFVIAAAIVFCLVAYTNAFNFMDGINGISCMQAALTALGTGLVAAGALNSFEQPLVLIAAAVSGVALGFLPHNFPRATMFMGDVGSAPLGFVLAALAAAVICTAGSMAMVPLILLHLNYLLDTGITLVRRILRGERFYEAHREHFYQRLVQAGRSHSEVTGLESVLQCVSLGLALVCLFRSMQSQMIALFLGVLFWTGFFLYSEISYRIAKKPIGDISGFV